MIMNYHRILRTCWDGKSCQNEQKNFINHCLTQRKQMQLFIAVITGRQVVCNSMVKTVPLDRKLSVIMDHFYFGFQIRCFSGILFLPEEECPITMTKCFSILKK